MSNSSCWGSRTVQPIRTVSSLVAALWVRTAALQLQPPGARRPHRSKETGGGHMGADQETLGGADWLKPDYQWQGTIFFAALKTYVPLHLCHLILKIPERSLNYLSYKMVEWVPLFIPLHNMHSRRVPVPQSCNAVRRSALCPITGRYTMCWNWF